MKTALAKQIYDDLESKILGNSYTSDDIFTEVKIAQLYKVSRTPAREALELLLANDLLLHDDESEHLIARNFSNKDYIDIFDLRIKMEGMIARLCTQNATDKICESLTENIILQSFYLEKQNFERICERDNQFHGIICENCNNWILQKINRDFHRYTKSIKKKSFRYEGRPKESVAEHKRICDAICSGNADLAEELAAFHVMQVKKNLLEHGYCK